MIRLKNAFLILVLGILIASCSGTNNEKQLPGKDISVAWEMMENSYKGTFNYMSKFVIRNNGKEALGNKGWNIYFNLPRKIFSDSLQDPVTIKHINGDFYRLSPTEKFNLNVGDSIEIEFLTSDWVVNYTDAPDGLYIVYSDEKGNESAPQVLNYTVRPFVRESQYKRFSGDNTPIITGALTYNKNQNTTLLPEDQISPIIPTPVYFKRGTASVVLDPSYSIKADVSLEGEKKYLASTLSTLFGQSLSDAGQKVIELKTGDITYQGKKLGKGAEAYQLDVKADKISITGSDAAGVFYGIQSLKALMPVDAFKGKNKSLEIKEVSVTDFPRFPHRGLSLDAARNFKPKDNVLKIIDVMSFYKLNKFHFHLTDDEGWRIEIKGLPELTEIGGNRGHSKDADATLPSFGSGPFRDPKSGYGSGFYTRAEFIEILKYATERHIEVIPEVDMPGHARAAIKSMVARSNRLSKEGNAIEGKKYLLNDPEDESQYKSVQGWTDNVVCVCQNSTYDFIELVVNDFVSMYKEAGAPLTTIHTGGDEVPHGVWQKSMACDNFIKEDPTLDSTDQLAHYFLRRVNEILKKNNLKTAGWEEIALKADKVKKLNKETGKVEETTVINPNPEFVNANFLPFVWNNVWGWGTEDNAYKLANAGYPVVLANVTNLYFDLAYNKSPEEPGYYWGGFVDTRKPFEFIPYDFYLSANEDRMGNAVDKNTLKDKVRLTEKGKKNIMGLQGNLWSENAKGNEVTEYLIFPKLLALAERAWSPSPSWSNVTDEAKRNQMITVDWNVFANALGQRELKRLDYMDGGVNYRISLPGAVVENGMLKANAEFPGLTIRYTTNGSEPDANSPVYKEPVKVSGTVKLKSFNSTGRSSRTVVVK